MNDNNNIKNTDDYFFSDKHKNWIINKTGSGNDILDLIDKVKVEVKNKFNVNVML